MLTVVDRKEARGAVWEKGESSNHGRRHHYGQCPYKFWEAPKLVLNVRTSFGRKILFYSKTKVLETVKHLTNLAIILKKKLSEFLKIWQKTSRDFSVAVDFA